MTTVDPFLICPLNEYRDSVKRLKIREAELSTQSS